jgi:nicotinamide mononucleotide transporter
MLLEFVQFLFSDWIQTIGVITGAGAVLFLALNKAKIGWTLGVINAAFFTVLMFQYMLYADVILNVYYLFTSAFGLVYWLGWMTRKEKKEPAKISHLNVKTALVWGAVWLAGTAAMGYALDTLTETDVAYVDSFTTVGSLIAQFLLARKIFENWYIWVFVDVIDIGLYLYKDLPMVAGMTVIYMVFCALGILKWKRDEKAERAATATATNDADAQYLPAYNEKDAEISLAINRKMAGYEGLTKNV